MVTDDAGEVGIGWESVIARTGIEAYGIGTMLVDEDEYGKAIDSGAGSEIDEELGCIPTSLRPYDGVIQFCRDMPRCRAVTDSLDDVGLACVAVDKNEIDEG